MRIRLRPSLLALGLASSVLTNARPVRAQANNGFELTWLAPAGCPTAEEVRSEIDRLLGSPAHAPAIGELNVRASVGHESRWLVTLETTLATRSGHRTISATSCQGLANATALIVALMIDPDAVAAHSRSPEKEPLAPAPVVEPAPSPARPNAPARKTFLLAGLGATGHWGVLPSPDLGVDASVGVMGSFWRVELRALYSPRAVHSQAMSDPPGAFGRFRLVTGTLAGCLTFKRAGLDFGPCLDFEAGVVQGEGLVAPITSSKTMPWLALGAGAVVVFKANRWLGFPVHVDAVVPVWRPRFNFDETPIFRSAVVGGRLTAGVEAQF
jgi:hypothetical protein